MKSIIEKAYGKSVSRDTATGKMKMAETLGMNNRMRDRDILEQEMEDIKNYHSPEAYEKLKVLQKEREEKIKKSFDEWLKKDHVTDFIGHIPSTPNHIIIKVFYYHELSDIKVTEGGILLTSGVEDLTLSSIHRVIPVGYVVASSSDNIKPGDLVNLPSLVGKTKISEEYKQWQKDIREQPTLKREESMKPPMYIGILSQWGQYIYQRNPFSDTDVEDQHTFCIPDRMIQSIRTDLK